MKLRRNGLLKNMLVEKIGRCGSAKRRSSGDDLVGGDAKTVDVRPGIKRFAPDLLRRHVATGPGRAASLLAKQSSLRDPLSEREINEPHFAGAIDHDIIRFHIAMDPAARIHISESSRGLLENAMSVFFDEIPFLMHDAELQ